MGLESLFGTGTLLTARQGWTDLMKRGSGIRQSRIHPAPLLRASVILISDMFSLWSKLLFEKKNRHDISFLGCLVFHVQLKALQAMVYFLPCFCCAAVVEEPCLTSAV